MPTARSSISGYINSTAAFLATSVGFLTTFVALILGVAIGALLGFDEAFMFSFNLFLSLAAIVISGIILVSSARTETALHVKLDYLIAASKASNTSVGLEHKDVREIEAERERIEKAIEEDLDGAIEEEVREQLDERSKAKVAAS